MNMAAELTAHRQLTQVKQLLEREAITVCQRLNAPDAPLAALQRACFVDYLEGLRDVWIQPETLSD